MGPVNCTIHGIQNYVVTSPAIAGMLDTNPASNHEIRPKKIYIDSHDKNSELWVDEHFLFEFGIDAIKSEIRLRDRNKVSKQLHDRLLIQRMIKKMRWVCPICLNELVGRLNVK